MHKQYYGDKALPDFLTHKGRLTPVQIDKTRAWISNGRIFASVDGKPIEQDFETEGKARAAINLARIK